MEVWKWSEAKKKNPQYVPRGDLMVIKSHGYHVYKNL